MSKVYRLYTGGPNTYQGWNGTPATPYNSQAIDTIQDPNGAAANREITSIPSPFARMELVKTAFAEVCRLAKGKSGQDLQAALDGNSIYHKMVSDSLDVGEIFFNMPKLKGKVEVIAWRPGGAGAQAGYGRQCYDSALQTFWQADGQTYNFAKCQGIYILNYIGGPAPLNIIGATSPATLFFSSANDLGYVQGVQFGQDRPFDAAYQPLYKRDPAYVEMLWTMKSRMQGFAGLFPEVNTYLDLTFAAIADQGQKQSLLALQTQSAPQASPIAIAGTANNVEILGWTLQAKVLRQVAGSDFTIRSARQPGSNCLVLPTDAGNRYAAWRYTTDLWGGESAAPAFDPLPPAKRTLPLDGTPQPYLTVSDFLEPVLLCSPHSLGGDVFLDGGYDDGAATQAEERRSCLLPLRPLFFEYFSPADIPGMLTMERVAGGGVNVRLSVPTQKGKVEYNRLYTLAPADEAKNEGHVAKAKDMENSLLTVQPAVATPANVEPLYTFAAMRPYGGKMDLAFYLDGQPVETEREPGRRNRQRELSWTDVHTLRSRWDCVRITTAHGSGMAVHKMRQLPAAEPVDFAIDLGTSNTHIEYRQGNGPATSLPLEWGAADGIIAPLFRPRTVSLRGKERTSGLEQERSLAERDLLPTIAAKAEPYHFPTRTVLSYAADIDWDADAEPLEASGLCLPYGKQMPLPYNRYATDIKWSDDAGAQKRAAHYIAALVRLCRDKALSLGAEPGRSRIVWFYPTSMSPHRRGLFQQVWADNARRYFGADAAVECISESLAPVLHHNQANATAKDMLTIDIGGGTTDMAFAASGELRCVTSFRFAANALFEDDILHTTNTNGLIDRFCPEYYAKADKLPELKSILDSVRSRPADMAATLFTIADIPCVRNSNLDIGQLDFTAKLRADGHFKLETIVFFAAILWHAGRMLRAKSLPLPRHIALSGNGSNILGALATPDNAGRQMLADFSRWVLEAAAGIEYKDGQKLELLGFGDGVCPKCATCKGGLLADGSQQPPKAEVLLAGKGMLRGDETYADIDESYIGQVAGACQEFFRALHAIDRQFSFADNFGMDDSAWTTMDDLLSAGDDIRTFIRKSIAARQEKADAPIVETCFFYPIAALLQQYSLAKYNELK